MRELLDLANNPLFVKHVRSRMRRSTLLPSIIVIVFLSLCIIGVHTLNKNPNNNGDSYSASIMFFVFQGILLVLMGGSQVATSIAQMNETGIIDYHRITPIPAKVQTIGILLGAPIRELLLYAFTLPFALYVAIDGPIGVTNFCKLVLVQLGGALMYYSLAMILGLTGGKARGASGRFVAVLAILNILSGIFFGAGIYGPTLITSTPVFYEVFIAPQEAEEEKERQQRFQQQQQQMGGARRPNQPPPPPPQAPPAEPKRKVSFYGVPLPIVLQSMMFQGCLLTFLFIGASRRIHSARLPLYTKPIALAFLGSLAILTMGSLWEDPTPFLTLGSVYFLVFGALMLTRTVTPSLGDVVKGMQRARKMSGYRVPPFSDLASNKINVLLYACIIGAAVSLGLLLAPQPPMRIINFNPHFSAWPPLTVGILSLLSFGFASQYFALAYGSRSKQFFGLYIFFTWLTPIILGMIILMTEAKEGTYVIAMSPIAGIAISGMFRVAVLDETTIRIVSIAPHLVTSVIFLALLINEERKLLGEVADEESARRRRKRDVRSDEDES